MASAAGNTALTGARVASSSSPLDETRPRVTNDEEKLMATLISVNVGMPQDVSWRGKTVHTGIWKTPVTGSVVARRLNLDGDGQGDLRGHGGEQRAVMVYQTESYDYWRNYLGRDDLRPGHFGENFTISGLSDREVCIGDRYRIGDAEFEVTQPRVTCFRVGMRLGEPAMPNLLVSHHRPGFYFRVVTEGHVQAGDAILRTRRGRHELSVADVDALLYLPTRDTDMLAKVVEVAALSPGWQESFRDMLAQRGIGEAPTGPAIAGWSGFRPLRVAATHRESPAVLSIELEAPPSVLPTPLPGQYLTVRIPGAGEPAPLRSYSLSGDPSAGTYRISVKREEHGQVSQWLHAHVRAGSVIEAAAPRGDFYLIDHTGPVVLISAGIGATPVLAMVHALAAAKSHREIWWLHTTRNAESHVFAAEVASLIDSLPHAQQRVFYTAGGNAGAAANGTAMGAANGTAMSAANGATIGPAIGIANGAANGATIGPAIGIANGAANGTAMGAAIYGRLDRRTIAALDLPTDATAYLCGPVGFMDAMREALVEAGLEPTGIHSELFGARAPINPGVVDEQRVIRPHQPSGTAGMGPRISFARSGLTVNWGPPYRTLLELAEACDVPTRYSCRSGVCHTCVTAVLDGTTSYSEQPLEVPADGTVLICCAAPSGDVVLDL